MAKVESARREMLRQRLLALACRDGTIPEETLTEQIDHLLEEVLHAPPVPEPEMALLDLQADDQRVVVTGLGLITPFGIDIAPFWAGLEEGNSAIAHITRFDARELPCQIAGEVPDFRPQEFVNLKEARRMALSSQFAVAAARLAVQDAGLVIEDSNRDEIGTLIACGSMAYEETEQTIATLLNQGPARVSPLYPALALPHMPVCQVAIQLEARGYSSSVSTACAASAQAIGEAAAIIRRGDATVMLAGGAEAPLSRLSIASFCAMRAMSRRNDEPQRASRPFDAERDGFVPAEGAGVLVLERLSHARQRGVPIYAELIGYASTCDAYHVAAPDPTGDGAARALRRALFNANIGPQQVDYINAHAPGTLAGDVAETLAIKQAFGEYAASIPISATKSMIGHMNGAAGAVEAAAAILALDNGVLPPTINQEFPDPRCDLDYVPNRSRPAALQTVMSNSFGFGGINTALIFRQVNHEG